MPSWASQPASQKMSSWLSSSPARPAPNPLTPSRRFNTNEASTLGAKTAGETKMQIDGIAPTFQKKPSIRHEQAGKKLVFECLVEAEPEPVVKWFHNGQALNVNSPRFKVSLCRREQSRP